MHSDIILLRPGTGSKIIEQLNNSSFIFYILKINIEKKVIVILTLFLWIVFSEKIFSQDSTEIKNKNIIESASDKERNSVGNDTVTTKKLWYQFENEYSTLNLGGGLLVDFASFLQDDASKKQFSLYPSVWIRDFRILLGGKIKSKRDITWKTGVMYNGEGSWFVRETGVIIGVPEISGSLFLGRTKVGTSLAKVMNGYSIWGVERPMILDQVQLLADGIKYMGFLPKQRIFWNAGLYADWLSESQTYSIYAAQGELRVGWMPFYDSKKNNLLHIGFNYSYAIPENGKIQVRSKPEANAFPYFVSTGIFEADHANLLGYEFYLSLGSFMFGSEAYSNMFSAPDSDNPVFKGGAIFANYFFTGEVHPYKTIGSIYGFVPVENSVFDGGTGAIELLLQYSAIDLNGGNISGGKFWRFTPMLNWYLSNHMRLEFVYGYGKLDRFNLLGTSQFFQSRAMFIF